MRATALDIYADRRASKLSNGNQRKLSLAIALIGQGVQLIALTTLISSFLTQEIHRSSSSTSFPLA
jgi:ABC-type branched-subunit amino acid transport system ATPase component